MAGDRTVLVVDDDEEITETYRGMLEPEYTVITANSGEAALEKLHSSVDVVLLDRRMPGMTGDDVLDTIRSRERDCRVVMITAVEPDTDIIGMAFDEYLVKPVTNEQLHDVVEQMIRRSEGDDRIQEIFAVASKLATLEAKLEYDQLDESEAYKNLRATFFSLREEDIVSEGDDVYMDATLENVETLLSRDQN